MELSLPKNKDTEVERFGLAKLYFLGAGSGGRKSRGGVMSSYRSLLGSIFHIAFALRFLSCGVGKLKGGNGGVGVEWF
jgi:hypothetical protein